VGSVLVPYLRSVYPEVELIGYDAGYFSSCLFSAEVSPDTYLQQQYYGDIRALPAELLGGVDAVIHLAAVSNDPAGVRFEHATHDVNELASIRLAKLSAQRGVKAFVFASSCSVYGLASSEPRTEQDEVNPLTAYAQSKVAAERQLVSTDFGDLTVTCLRFATACGASPRLRIDLVLNDFVLSALLNKTITIQSNGSPWRPLIDVEDMARALTFGISRSIDSGPRALVLNAGSVGGNYQVIELAKAVAALIPGTDIAVNLSAPDDPRSYKVDFSKFAEMAPDHAPKLTIEHTITRLIENISPRIGQLTGDKLRDFRRLSKLEQLVSRSLINNDLYWTTHKGI
jgi:nucleoside-diphosphate-sugar epimerase